MLILLAGLGITEATGVTQLASTVIRLTTGSGTLVIETDDPGVKVTIDGEEVQIQGAGVEQLTLKPGQYKIAAVKDGKPVSQELVAITRGGKQVVRVTMEGIASGDSSVSRDPKGNAISSNDPDRRAAEWVLAQGGSVDYSTPVGGITRLEPGGRLPAGAVILFNAHLNQTATTDDDLRRFVPLQNLDGLHLGKTSVTDAGLKQIGQLTSLKDLYLHFTNITDHGVHELRNLKELRQLSLAFDAEISNESLQTIGGFTRLEELAVEGTRITDAGLVHLAELSKLRQITLGNNSRITNLGMPHLAKLGNLQIVQLVYTKVGDAGLLELAKLSKLSVLALEKTRITDAGMSTIGQMKSLKSLTIHGNEISDAGLEPLRQLPNLAVLLAGSSEITDAGLRHLGAIKSLTKLDVSGSITDDGVRALEPLPNLTWLKLGSGKITTAGVQKLAAVLPRCRIEWDGGVIEPTMSDDRQAAEYVLSMGGKVQISRDGRESEIGSVDDLPSGEIKLVGIHLENRPGVEDGDLARFRDFTTLTNLHLGGMPIGDAGLENFRNCRELKNLYLSGTNVTDAGLAHFQNCRSLQSLFLRSTKVSDAGLAHFKDCEQLVSLYLGNTAITDAGLAHLGAQRHLVDLNLSGPLITDAGLLQLQQGSSLKAALLSGTRVTDRSLKLLEQMPQLSVAELKKTDVSEAGIKQLAAALPQCRIEWDGGVIEPRETSAGWHGWPADAPKPAIAPFDAEQAKKYQEDWAKYLDVPVEYTNSLGMKFRLIPPGEFLMGSTEEEVENVLKTAVYWRDLVRTESPHHKVILTQPIYLGAHEVTQQQYEVVMGENPSSFAATGLNKDKITNNNTAVHPVENLDWTDAIDFCVRLSQKERLKPSYFRADETVTWLDGAGYRLPTEALWEFACRAGTTTVFWNGNLVEELMQSDWIGGNSGGRSHAVGELKANPFGLYDVHGNVSEWSHNGWDPAYYDQFKKILAVNPTGPIVAEQHAARGGEWYVSHDRCRSACRGAGGRVETLGFRVALSVDAVKETLNK